MKKKEFPLTPKPVMQIGKWYVAISYDEKHIYFWDGKEKNFNFMYSNGIRWIKTLVPSNPLSKG